MSMALADEVIIRLFDFFASVAYFWLQCVSIVGAAWSRGCLYSGEVLVDRKRASLRGLFPRLWDLKCSVLQK